MSTKVISAQYVKRAGAVLDYRIDWAAWLDTDTISTSTWAEPTSGITIDSETETTTVATVWLSGGTAGQLYEVTNTIVTAAGRTEERTIQIEVVG